LNITDDSPNLFRLGDEDPGFNIWSLSVDAVLNFETGVQAFTGAGTWTVDAATFAIFESANAEGDIYFPADSEDDLADASFIGTYRILGKGGPCAFEVGDVNQDGAIDLLDVAPFVDSIGMTAYVCEADVNQDGSNDLLDVAPFVDLLAGG
jgi:hypothetical protein